MLRWPRFMKVKLPLETERVQPYSTIAMLPVINTMIVTTNKDDIIAMIIFKNDNGLPPEAVIITTINEL